MNQQSMEAEVTGYFDKLDKEYPLAVKAYQSIIATCDSIIVSNNLYKLPSLITYIEAEDGQYAFRYIASTHRFLKIFYILLLEKNTILPHLFTQNAPPQMI